MAARFPCHCLVVALSALGQGFSQVSLSKIPAPFPVGETIISVNQVETAEFPKVKLFASVTLSGIPLTGLTAENFRVRENNIDQIPISVSPQRDALSAVVLLDVSGSMKSAIENTKAAAIQFIRTLDKADRVAVITFHEKIDTIYPLGQDFAAAENAVAKIRHLGDTALYDGVHSALRAIQEVPGRRAVIVLSDGVDDNGKGRQLSKKDLDEPLLLAIQTNIPIYTIGLGTKMDTGILKTFASTTGAEYANAPDKDELIDLYNRIGQKLSVQYAITYTSTEPLANGLREVKLDYVIPSKKPYAAPKPVFNEVGKVISYRAPLLEKEDQFRLARMAGVGRMAKENKVKPLSKFIEEAPLNWPEGIPAHPKAKNLQSGADNANKGAGSFSFDISESPEDFLKTYLQILQDNDWTILSQTKAANPSSLSCCKAESKMTVGIRGENNQTKVTVEYSLARPETLRVERNNANQIIAANGRDVLVAAGDGILIITGGCGKLKLSGVKNQVQCDSAKSVEITGNENVVILGALGEAVLEGNRNELAWGGGFEGREPKITNTGEGNQTKKLE